ncbi:GNAT family N-acetyltransferase [Pseudooceanicola nanhaiensis]|uniref:GNAT family N-acetyltransferase n=1 Tax=Pseudooceanicola nanhaiensis TaxID=375761 RepID=UPI001CD562E5|nr:GNAT family N-acetyltransferase [Pseudooceanicola nanhaiensis]MCA0918921.1 GNAT family N-acetyltransferase [Pseudooceanicola nanhaiensis]
MESLHLSPLTPDDAAEAAALFFRAVREGTQAHYTAQQRAAWAPAPPDPAAWREKFTAQFGVTAREGGSLAGFITMDGAGYLDLAFVAPEWMGRGVAVRLYAALEEEARRRGLGHLTSEASHLARPFLLRQGWQVITAQQVERRGVTLENFRMEKRL